MLKNCANMSPQECITAETTVDRITSLQAVINCLETAEEVLTEEGFMAHGTIPEMINQVRLIIRQVEDSYLEGE